MNKETYGAASTSILSKPQFILGNSSIQWLSHVKYLSVIFLELRKQWSYDGLQMSDVVTWSKAFYNPKNAVMLDDTNYKTRNRDELQQSFTWLYMQRLSPPKGLHRWDGRAWGL